MTQAPEGQLIELPVVPLGNDARISVLSGEEQQANLILREAEWPNDVIEIKKVALSQG